MTIMLFIRLFLSFLLLVFSPDMIQLFGMGLGLGIRSGLVSVQGGVGPSLIEDSTPVNAFLFASGILFNLVSCTRSSYSLHPTIDWAVPIYGTATY